MTRRRPKGKYERLTISLPGTKKRAFVRHVKKQGVTMSAFLTEAGDKLVAQIEEKNDADV